MEKVKLGIVGGSGIYEIDGVQDGIHYEKFYPQNKPDEPHEHERHEKEPSEKPSVSGIGCDDCFPLPVAPPNNDKSRPSQCQEKLDSSSSRPTTVDKSQSQQRTHGGSDNARNPKYWHPTLDRESSKDLLAKNMEKIRLKVSRASGMKAEAVPEVQGPHGEDPKQSDSEGEDDADVQPSVLELGA